MERSESSLVTTGSGTEGTTLSTTVEDKGEDESEEPKLIYVDAPPPLVNPWRVNPSTKPEVERSESSLASTGSGSGSSGIEGTTSSTTGEDKDEEEVESEEPKIIYVDAPPPLVNPWRVNPNAASVIAKKIPQSGTINGSAPTPRPAPALTVKVGNGHDRVNPNAASVIAKKNPQSGRLNRPVPSPRPVPAVTVKVGNGHDRVNPNAASVFAKKTPQTGRLNRPAPSPRPSPAAPIKVGNGLDVKVSKPTPTPAQTSTPSKQSPPAAQLAQPPTPTPKPAPVLVPPATVKLQPASSKGKPDPWDIKRIRRQQESSIVLEKLSGDDWPALEPTIEEVQKNMTSLTLECKIVNFDSSSTGSGDSLEEELQSPEKLCAEKWPIISSGDNTTTKKVRTSRKVSNDYALPSLESTQSTRQQHTSGDENGSGSTSVSSDDTVAEVNMESSTDEIEVPTRKTKKSAKLKWVPLKLPETVTPKHRVKREKSLKFKSSRFERGESPSGNSGRGRSRGGARGRGAGRGSSRNSHQYFFNESSDPNVIPPPNQRDDYTDYPPDFTTLAPVFPEASEFIMPYVADNYFASSFVQPADSPSTATSPAVSFVPVGLEDLVELLKQQIEYYFSEENLEKDFYLRRKMDSEGYLPIKLIASFQRVQNMTHDHNIVVSAILSSEILEVKEDMSCVRTMITPTKWPIADTLYLTRSLAVSASGFSCPVSSQVPSTNVPHGVVLSEPRSIQAV